MSQAQLPQWPPQRAPRSVPSVKCFDKCVWMFQIVSPSFGKMVAIALLTRICCLFAALLSLFCLMYSNSSLTTCKEEAGVAGKGAWVRVLVARPWPRNSQTNYCASCRAPISGRGSCPLGPQNVPRFWGIALGPGGLAAALTVCIPCESRPCTTAGRGLLLAERSPTSRRACPRPIPITMIHRPIFARLFLDECGSALILLFFGQKRVQLCVCGGGWGVVEGQG